MIPIKKIIVNAWRGEKNKEKNPTPICIFNLNLSKLDRGENIYPQKKRKEKKPLTLKKIE